MTTCRHRQDAMVEVVYGELDDARRAELAAHVKECAECASLLSELQSTAALMNRRRRPDPGPEFWDGFWRRLEERVAREDSDVVDSSRFARRRLLGSWGYRVAAAVAVLAAGVWIGRTVLAPAPMTDSPPAVAERANGPTGHADEAPGREDEVAVGSDESSPMPIDAPREAERATASAPEAVVVSQDDAALRYLERSQLLLLAVLNGDPGASNFATHRERAGELVRTASTVREASNDRRVQDLVKQLEFILREIAHLEEGSDVENVEVIRDRVNREGVLLRINLQQMRSARTASHEGAID